MKLAIPRKLLSLVVESCRGSPVERVFFGVGRAEGDTISVHEVEECPNVSETPTVRFLADPLCTLRVFESAEGKGMRVVMLAHCHPAPPRPSPEDLRGMSLSSAVCWLIVSSLTGEYKAWILEKEEPREVEVEALEA
ncbi:MAG: M67 family metallopeptidase [Desulfurococcaceae archaeon]